ncbi:helix-turn-helix domain-containing protein [Mesobacterium pallidum]|uniref:helix-turn-helix domain-containing protein n=1 Tax=Mesobacterium pallidum TaxID=2872037 RepID=UPI001EE2A87F|nr:helix-turn-helix domain-containing protein [Mesobacterium pallidum]
MSYQDPTLCGVRGGDPLRPAPRPGRFVVDRWQVLQLVKDTARDTGIGEREIAVLSAHLSVLAKGPVRADQLLVSYAQVSGILDRANCMDERRFRRGEARLEELGFVIRKLSANGRRYPVRDGKGQVVDAYGIDLRPLFLRLDELEATRASRHEEQQRRAALRSRISARVSAVKRLAEAHLGHVPEALIALGQEIRNLLRRATASLADMARAETALEAAAAQWDSADAPERPAPDMPVPDTSAVDAGQNARHTDSPMKRNTRAVARAEAVSVPDVWRRCPEVSACFPSPPTGPREANERLVIFSSFLGLGQQAVTSALELMGWARVLIALDYMAGRIETIKNPDGYLAHMARAYKSGQVIAGGRLRIGQDI